MTKPTERFCQVIQLLAAGLAPSRAVDEPMFLAYWIGLRDLDQSDIETAAARAIRECEHMPRPSELRRMAGQLTADARALYAVSDIRRAITGLGPYKSVWFADPLINRAIELEGGWVRVASAPLDELDRFILRQLGRSYSSLVDAGDPGTKRHHPGIHERNNNAIGCDPPAIARVPSSRPEIGGSTTPATEVHHANFDQIAQ